MKRFPWLANSTRAEWHRWVTTIYQDSGLYREWMEKTYPAPGDGGLAVTAGLVEMIVFSPQVQRIDDHKCRFVHPFLWDIGSPDVDAMPGAKVKVSGPVVPAVLAGYDDHLVLANYVGQKELLGNLLLTHVSVIARQEVRQIVDVKVGRLLGSVPGLQLQLSDPETARIEVMTLLLNDMFPKKFADMTRSEVRDF